MPVFLLPGSLRYPKAEVVESICYILKAVSALQYIWDLWGEQVSPLANHIPYMTAVGTEAYPLKLRFKVLTRALTFLYAGNHEKYYNFTSYDHRFHMPGEESGGLGNFYHRSISHTNALHRDL